MTLTIIILIGLVAIGAGCWFNRKTPYAIPGIALAVALICVYAIFLPDILNEFTDSEQTAALLVSIMLVLALAVIFYLTCYSIFKKMFKKNTKSKASASRIPGARVATVGSSKKYREERKTDPPKPTVAHPEVKQLNERIFDAAKNGRALTVKKTKLPKVTSVADKRPKTTGRKSEPKKNDLKSRLNDRPKAVLAEPEFGFEELKEDIFEETAHIKKSIAAGNDNTKKEYEPEIEKEPETNKKDDDKSVAAVLPDKKYKPTFVRKRNKKNSDGKDKGEIKTERRRKDDGDDFVFPDSRLASGEIAVDLRARLKRATEYSELDEMKLEVPAEILEHIEDDNKSESKDIPPSDIKTAFAHKAKKDFEKSKLAFEGCFLATDDMSEKKQIELEILDILIRMERNREATTKVFNIISAGYDLNSVEKARLVNIMRILENQT